MDQRQAFLQAIVEAPDDDVPRLVFADWLDDEGDADRAAFIRTQCALAKIELDDPRRPDLERREDELLGKRTKWIEQEVPEKFRKEARFRRGFVEHVNGGKVEKLPAGAGELLARLPLTSVRISRAHPQDVEALAAIPFVALRKLHLYDVHSESMKPLLEAAFLPELRKLRLSAWTRSMNVPAVAALLESPIPARLTHLDLDSFCLHKEDFQRLSRSEVGGRLTYLRMDVLANEQARDLSTGKRFANLRSLDFNDDILMTDAALRAIAKSANFRDLRRLNLRGIYNLTDEGMLALASAAHLGQLVDLTVSGRGVTDDGIKALIESPNLPSLGRIEVSDCSGVSADWPFWRPRRGKGARVLWMRDVRK